MEASDDSQFMAWQRRGYQHWAEQDIKTAATIFRLLGALWALIDDMMKTTSPPTTYQIKAEKGKAMVVQWHDSQRVAPVDSPHNSCDAFGTFYIFARWCLSKTNSEIKKRTTKTLIVKRIVFDNRRQHNCDDGGWGELCFQIPLTLECGSQGTGHHAAITVHPISRS